MKVFTFVRVLR